MKREFQQSRDGERMARDFQRLVEMERRAKRTGIHKTQEERQRDSEEIERTRRRLLNKYKLT